MQATPQVSEQTSAARATPSESVVRLVQSDEIENMLALMYEAEAERMMFPISEVRARDMLNRAFMKQGGIAAAIGPKGAIEAASYLALAQMPYSDIWIIEESFQYVRPAFRRSTHAKSLLEFAKKCHHDIGPHVLVGVMHTIRTEAKVRLYRRQFGEPVGAFFMYPRPATDTAPLTQLKKGG